MSQTILELTKELVKALIETNTLSPDEMQDILYKTHGTLMELQDKETSRGVEPEPVDWKKSVTRHSITCLECGAMFKQLSGKHLKHHGLDARSYREKYGIPRTQPLAAEEITARRQQIVQRVRPWEKAPTFLKSHGEKGWEKNGDDKAC